MFSYGEWGRSRLNLNEIKKKCSFYPFYLVNIYSGGLFRMGIQFRRLVNYWTYLDHIQRQFWLTAVNLPKTERKQ